MTKVFADTFYFLALLDAREERHPQAAAASRDPRLQIVTTEWVLAESATPIAMLDLLDGPKPGEVWLADDRP